MNPRVYIDDHHSQFTLDDLVREHRVSGYEDPFTGHATLAVTICGSFALRRNGGIVEVYTASQEFAMGYNPARTSADDTFEQLTRTALHWLLNVANSVLRAVRTTGARAEDVVALSDSQEVAKDFDAWTYRVPEGYEPVMRWGSTRVSRAELAEADRRSAQLRVEQVRELNQALRLDITSRNCGGCGE